VKVVLDTNVLVSGSCFRTACRGGSLRHGGGPIRSGAVGTAARRNRTCPFVPEDPGATPVGGDEIARFLLLLRFKADIVDIAAEKAGVRAIPGRSGPCHVARRGRDCLVSGDGDLLALRDRFPIQTPAEFVRRLK